MDPDKIFTTFAEGIGTDELLVLKRACDLMAICKAVELEKIPMEEQIAELSSMFAASYAHGWLKGKGRL